ncbi:unnamed protein product, partial [Eruca vesicaria subsp. sativa]|nr:unnamed protein product [Eruca vesicaria subsp. sativa]
MVNAKESFENKKWEDLLTYTKEAIEQGVDLSTELYMNRAEAFLAANLVEEAVSELSSAILSLFKKKHGFKSPGKKEEEAEINEEHFKKATWDISEEKCDLLLEIEEEELQELEDDLLDRVKGLEGAVSLIKKFYQPLINQRADRIQILKGKKERFCTEKLAQSLKKKQ